MMKQTKIFSLTKGVALLQVLLITSILSLLALHFSLTSRNQVDIAGTLQDKIQAEIKLQDWRSKLQYALLTQPLNGLGKASVENNEISATWNFHGKAFSPANDVKITIQDLNGLVSLNNTTMNDLAKLLSYLKVPDVERGNIMLYIENNSGRSKLISSSSKRQQMTLGSGLTFFQSETELTQVTEISPELYKQLAPLVTAGPANRFNFLNAPDEILKAFFQPEIANAIIQLRTQQQLTVAKFLALTGIQDTESLAFVPGQFHFVQLEVAFGNAVAKSRFICYIRPESQMPLTWLD